MNKTTNLSILKIFQNFRIVLANSFLEKVFRKLKVGRLLVNLYSQRIIKNGFHSCFLLGRNINFRVSTKAEITHIDLIEKLEGQLLRRLINTIQAQDVFYDIGANIGIICLPVAILRNSEQPVIFAFEPHPETAQRLKENIALNDLRINVYRLAIGDRCGRAKLNIENFGDSTHTIVNSVLKSKKSIEVPIITIDEFVKQSHPPPNIIKIDVEGYEMKVLLGMKKTLESNLIRHLFIEVHPNLLQVTGIMKEN
jgi:FkbM family methyltransferase